MPVLENPKHERFAQEIAKGVSGRDAYKSAGYSVKSVNVADVNASRLLTNAKVKARVVEIQARAAVRAEVSRADVLKRLDAQAARAELMDGPAAVQAARGALMDIAKLEGWVIERKENGAPGEFAGLDNPRDVEEAIAERLGLARPRNSALGLSAGQGSSGNKSRGVH